jgi:hypothetical protein
MKLFKVNGIALTAHEINLLEMGDVDDTNELRDLAKLRERVKSAPVMSRRRLQVQIDALTSAQTRV